MDTDPKDKKPFVFVDQGATMETVVQKEGTPELKHDFSSIEWKMDYNGDKANIKMNIEENGKKKIRDS
jgi:hypothetical protein